MLSIRPIEGNNVLFQALPAAQILRSVVPQCPLYKGRKSEGVSTSNLSTSRIQLTVFEQTCFLVFCYQQWVVVVGGERANIPLTAFYLITAYGSTHDMSHGPTYELSKIG